MYQVAPKWYDHWGTPSLSALGKKHFWRALQKLKKLIGSGVQATQPKNFWAPSGPTHLPLPSGSKSQFTKTQNLQKHENIPKLTSGPFHGQSTCPGSLYLRQAHSHANTHTTHIPGTLKLLTQIQFGDGAHLRLSAHAGVRNPNKTYRLRASSTHVCLQHSNVLKHTKNTHR